MALIDLQSAKQDLKRNALAYLTLALLLPTIKNLGAFGIETTLSDSLPSTGLCILIGVAAVMAGLLIRFRSERIADID